VTNDVLTTAFARLAEMAADPADLYIGLRLRMRGQAPSLPVLREHVFNQLVQYGWETGQDTPKTDDSAAAVALDADTVLILRAHRRRQDDERRLPGSSGWRPGCCSSRKTAARCTWRT
jgi:hypothetical protein